ncbi:OB-fold domain-containing protein [Ramlibacter sp. H39-3-26]|uniref:Zn-ribbon domain-containing OB-fold protein n=1 Tax=Curvibacter soli TaxID=3031331 RepID=UPI0023DA4BD4|nr:OB-fold domain-containing protein [Ramlibacter sp. H39-3-26]MDF1485634.1 OB-fold domain-containing protein [Ramlibacter sp. H39-3-26]
MTDPLQTEPQPEREYFQFLAEGRFMIQRSASSGEYVFYPRVAAPRTGARDLQWVPASGRGTVHATTVIRPKPPQAPYNVALVTLVEGPRMMSRVEGVAPEAVTIGMAVRARITTEGDKPVVVFDPQAAQ